jgi:Ca-activated chloride channel family protein
MWELDERKYLYLLLLLPVLLVVFLYNIYWKRKKQREFGDAELIRRLSPDKSVFKQVLKVVIIMAAIACLVIALVNPKVGMSTETIKREGIDIVFAIDVSKSMLCEDVAPGRLEKSKQIVSQIINQLGSDRIGIVAYAGSAFPVLPITTDYNAAKMFLQSINTDIVSSQGTSLDEAIELSTSYFEKDKGPNKLLILISDGEDHSAGAEDAAADAKKAGLKIITIGVGTPQGGPIPLKVNGVVQSFKRDNSNNVVITKLNSQALQDIATATGGKYLSGNNTKMVVESISGELENIEKSEFGSQQFTDYNSQFQWFLALALILLCLDLFLLERKTAWITKLNLFNEKE